MLLFEFIDEDKFAPGLPEFVVDEGAGDYRKEEVVEEDKHHEKYEVGLVVLDRKPLVVRVVVEGRKDVHAEYHPAQRLIVILVRVYRHRVLAIPEVGVDRQTSISYQGEPKYHYPEKCYEHQNVHVG